MTQEVPSASSEKGSGAELGAGTLVLWRYGITFLYIRIFTYARSLDGHDLVFTIIFNQNRDYPDFCIEEGLPLHRPDRTPEFRPDRRMFLQVSFQGVNRPLGEVLTSLPELSRYSLLRDKGRPVETVQINLFLAQKQLLHPLASGVLDFNQNRYPEHSLDITAHLAERIAGKGPFQVFLQHFPDLITS